jgi:hypothetical protein
MILNRTQALFLVGSIAAASCVVHNEEGDDEETGGGSGTGGGDTGGSSTGGKSTGGTAGKGGSYTGGSNTGGTGATCNDDVGTPVSCDGFMEPGAGGESGAGYGGEGYGGAGGAGPSCEGMAYLQTDFCDGLWDTFKPAVANNARTCMKAQAPADICVWDTTFGCAMEAMLGACPDDTADDECATIQETCPDLTDVDCHNVLNGMTQAGRDAVVSCAAETLECNLWICAGVASPAGE